MRHFDRDERVIYTPAGTTARHEARVLHLQGDGTVVVRLDTGTLEAAHTAELERCRTLQETP